MKARDIVNAAIKEGFDEAVANIYSNARSYLKITNSKIDSVVDKFTESGDLFVSSRKKVFFTNIQRLDKKGIENSVARTKDAVKLIVPKKDYYGIANGPFKYTKAQGADKRIENYTTGTIAGAAHVCINTALDNGAENVAGSLFLSHTSSEMSTSKNVDTKGKQTIIRISLRVFNKIDSFQNIVSARYMKDIRLEKFSKETTDLLNQISKPGRIGPGTYDIIYLPSPGGGLVSATTAMATMGSIETGSFFTKKLGKIVASRDVTIYDDGNMKGAIDARPFDDEGHPTQRTPIIENGVLKHYLHNFSTAKKYETKSTGNAGLVMPEPNTMVFEHRKRVSSIHDLIRRVDRGILVTNTWYTRFANDITGDFSTVPRDLALYIENGEPRFAIRQRSVVSMVGIRITDNMIRMLKSIECAARDTTQATSWETEGDYYFMPSILVRDVTVTTA